MSPPASISDADLEAQQQKQDAHRPKVTSSLMATPAEPRHRQLADPSPLGLLAFAQALFLISLFGVHPHDVTTPNVLISSLIAFGGLGMTIAGIFAFIHGNTFGATVFCTYAGFQLSYALIYIPGSGIIAAYTDSVTGLPTAEFTQAIALFVWAWFIVTVIFTVAAIRSNLVMLLVLVFTDLTLLFLAAEYHTGIAALGTASCAFGFVTAFLAYWAAAAALWSISTPIQVPMFPLVKETKSS
ncbi:putative GPR1/FUN34/yaaH family-domain-containing protein [Seiridium cardinale]